MLRAVKYLLISVGGLLAAFVTLIAYSYYFPPTYEASAHLPDSTSQVILELQPTHLYLAEYRRTLFLRSNPSKEKRMQMFPDTGGYSRTHLYNLGDGHFRIEGFFDAFIVDARMNTISLVSKATSFRGQYLGTFDDTGDGRWRFIPVAERPERALKEPE
jgi:hypothetical protein